MLGTPSLLMSVWCFLEEYCYLCDERAQDTQSVGSPRLEIYVDDTADYPIHAPGRGRGPLLALWAVGSFHAADP